MKIEIVGTEVDTSPIDLSRKLRSAITAQVNAIEGMTFEEAQSLEKRAIDVHKEAERKKRQRHFEHTLRTCGLLGCDKRPRAGKAQSNHKARRRNFVFCPKHVGLRTVVGKASYARLRSDRTLKVQVVEA